MTNKTLTVLGAGSWGTALSLVLADNGHDVRLWSYHKEQAEKISGKPQKIKRGKKIVGEIYYRDGTLLDTILSQG